MNYSYLNKFIINILLILRKLVHLEKDFLKLKLLLLEWVGLLESKVLTIFHIPLLNFKKCPPAFPALASARRPSVESSTRRKLKSTLPDSPFLPKLGLETKTSTPADEPDKESTPKDNPEQRWQRIHSKVGPITIPKVFIDEKQHELEVSEHLAKLDALPHLDADFIQNVDFFAKFLGDNNIKSDELNDFAKFTRFCQLHGDFEKKQRLYYALIARRAVKLRQIDAVNEELKTYEIASNILDKIVDNTDSKKMNESQLSTEFSRIIEEYAEKSFQLCSLKSREEHVSTKFRLLKAKADRDADRDGEIHLVEEQKIQQRHIAILDLSILEELSK